MTRPLTLSIGKGKFLKKSKKIYEPPHELHHMSATIAYQQIISAYTAAVSRNINSHQLG